MSVCWMNDEISETIRARLSGVRMNAEISETMGARLLRSGVQIPELLTQRKLFRHSATPTLTP